jgi:hypothetical protein
MRHQGLQHGITGVEYIRHLMRSKARGVITAQEGRQRFVTAGRE